MVIGIMMHVITLANSTNHRKLVAVTILNSDFRQVLLVLYVYITFFVIFFVQFPVISGR